MGRKKYQIIFQDKNIVVCDKPAGTPVVPGRNLNTTSLKQLLQSKYDLIYPVHRIDKDTSGIVCFALDTASHKILSAQFQNREVYKEYICLVEGIPWPPQAKIDAPLVVKGNGRVDVSKKGKFALSEYEVLDSFKGISLLKVIIKTGRTHQIRVHMKYVGHPLLVDPIYGNSEAFFLSSLKNKYSQKKNEKEKPLLGRLSLHASKISFKHPVSNEVIEFSSSIPKDINALINQLKKL